MIFSFKIWSKKRIQKKAVPKKLFKFRDQLVNKVSKAG